MRPLQLVTWLALVPVLASAEPTVHQMSRPQMGTVVNITVWHDDGGKARAGMIAAFAEIERLEAMLSEWRPTSELSRVNREAHQRPVPVSRETFEVLTRAHELGVASKGAFDMSWAALRGVWRFDQRTAALPDPAQLKAATARIDYRKVVLDKENQTVRLSPGMALGLGGIAKGYAADKALAVLKGHGLGDVIVNAGGDVAVRGKRGLRHWKVGIRNPRGAPDALLAVVKATDEALVSSGDYERFVTIGGKRYHHILTPSTGLPARGAIAVSVLAKRAMDADAACTAAFVLGGEAGIAFLESLPGVEGLIVLPDGRLLQTKGARSRIVLRMTRVTVE